MSKLLRYYEKGSIYFLTVVTHQRNNILVSSYTFFKESLDKMVSKHNIELIAWVVLPDHFHILIDPKDNNPASFIHDFKLSFGAYYRKEKNLYSGRVWQSRFWDHIIRDQQDYNNHIDYIHYNPVKHSYVNSPFDWNYSSINEFEKRGYYQKDWGEKRRIDFDGDFGE